MGSGSVKCSQFQKGQNLITLGGGVKKHFTQNVLYSKCFNYPRGGLNLLGILFQISSFFSVVPPLRLVVPGQLWLVNCIKVSWFKSVVLGLSFQTRGVRLVLLHYLCLINCTSQMCQVSRAKLLVSGYSVKLFVSCYRF